MSNTVPVINAVTVDLEEWFHTLYYEHRVRRDEWDRFDSRIALTTERTLDLFDRCGVRATFFVLGWLADRHPEIVRRIHAKGHEVASHSYWHRLVHTMTPEAFAEDLAESLRAITAATGEEVTGYRAPSFSVTDETAWFFRALAEAGIRYDSSVLPIRRYYGGMPDAPRQPHWVRTDAGEPVREFPISTYRLFGRNCAFSGGGYFRLLPLWSINRAIERLNESGLPVTLYFHPWEIDPDPPHLAMSLRERVGGRFSHELFRGGMEEKLERVLNRFNFGPMGEIVESSLPGRAIA